MIQQQQQGYTPGMYVRAWRRMNTGQLRSIGKPWQVVRLQRTDELDLDEMPTMPIPRKTERLLPLDVQGRPYLKRPQDRDMSRAANDQDLLGLCDEIVREYRYLSGEYPAELVLSAYRYLTLDAVSVRVGGYCMADETRTIIPYTYDASIRFPDFCVMARGLAGIK